MLTLKQLILLALSNLKCKEEPLTFAIHLPLFCLFGCIICAQDKQKINAHIDNENSFFSDASQMQNHYFPLLSSTHYFILCPLPNSPLPSLHTHDYIFLDVTHKFENCSFILSLLEQEGNIHRWVCECNTLF